MKELTHREKVITEELDKFVKACKDSYRSKDDKPAKIPTDMLALSIMYEIRRLNMLHKEKP